MERAGTKFKKGIEERYGLLIGINEVTDLLRIGKAQAYSWLADISYIEVNGRRRWMTSDVAEKLYEAMQPPTLKRTVTTDEIYDLLPKVQQ